MEEERDDIVILVDETGEEVEFELIDTIELNGNEYVVLAPLDEEATDEEEEEIIILKIEHGEDGEDSFLTIEDDEEMDLVFEEFQSRMDEDFGEDED